MIGAMAVMAAPRKMQSTKEGRPSRLRLPTQTQVERGTLKEVPLRGSDGRRVPGLAGGVSNLITACRARARCIRTHNYSSQTVLDLPAMDVGGGSLFSSFFPFFLASLTFSVLPFSGS